MVYYIFHDPNDCYFDILSFLLLTRFESLPHLAEKTSLLWPLRFCTYFSCHVFFPTPPVPLRSPSFGIGPISHGVGAWLYFSLDPPPAVTTLSCSYYLFFLLTWCVFHSFRPSLPSFLPFFFFFTTVVSLFCIPNPGFNAPLFMVTHLNFSPLLRRQLLDASAVRSTFWLTGA